jgi:hypothetical protein
MQRGQMTHNLTNKTLILEQARNHWITDDNVFYSYQLYQEK